MILLLVLDDDIAFLFHRFLALFLHLERFYLQPEDLHVLLSLQLYQLALHANKYVLQNVFRLRTIEDASDLAWHKLTSPIIV
jgi:hypothetical protein